uniref:Head fiber protein n=1 Tax=Caenorhabditis tropicalis TaxID=1561998 RepID=A0A1I7UBN8_9PELO
MNQSPTADVANNRVKTDLNLAIGQGLTANQIYLYIPPTLNFTFTPPSITIADGNKCITDNTYVAISGTVIYKCVGSGVTASPVTGATDASTDSTTTGPSTSTGASSGSTQSSSSKIKSTPFIQAMTVTATASQPLYENQWNQIARSVQKALEAKQMLFDDEIQVALL